jgi:hypothetical protein
MIGRCFAVQLGDHFSEHLIQCLAENCTFLLASVSLD